MIDRPRHIEVQIVGDAAGNVVHLYDRDCSVQLRNQKVVEVAPATGLPDGLRQQILDGAVALADAAGYTNAGTVEFLVSPEHESFAFIELNPRIQVEHTVTEEVMGVDLVEAQFRIAGGATLTDLGLDSVGTPRGVSVQARVVATGAGTLDAYREPSGPGVRVDGCGYAGYAPPPQFDPLLAKVIGTSRSGDVADAVDRVRRAVEELLVAGLPTNRAQLLAILARPEVRGADARTTMLSESPDLADDVASPVPTTSGCRAPSRSPGRACRSPPASTWRARRWAGRSSTSASPSATWCAPATASSSSAR